MNYTLYLGNTEINQLYAFPNDYVLKDEIQKNVSVVGNANIPDEAVTILGSCQCQDRYESGIVLMPAGIIKEKYCGKFGSNIKNILNFIERTDVENSFNRNRIHSEFSEFLLNSINVNAKLYLGKVKNKRFGQYKDEAEYIYEVFVVDKNENNINDLIAEDSYKIIKKLSDCNEITHIGEISNVPLSVLNYIQRGICDSEKNFDIHYINPQITVILKSIYYHNLFKTGIYD